MSKRTSGMMFSDLVGAIAVILMTGCGGGGESARSSVNESEPNMAELRKELVAELPEHVKVTDFNVESMEKAGTEEKPKFDIRFKATVEMTEELFSVDEVRGDTIFMKPTGAVGDSAIVEGAASSIFSADDWAYFVRVKENYTLKGYGKPRSEFAAGAIVKGSPEEAKFYADLEATDAEFQASIAELDLTAMIGEFYEKDRKGKSFLYEMLAHRVEKKTNMNAFVHAKFTFAKAESRNRSSGTIRRAFTLRRKEGEPWRVAYMGPRDSGKID